MLVVVWLFQVNKSQLQQLKDRFAAFLQGETHIAADEAFINAVTSYYEVTVKSYVRGDKMRTCVALKLDRVCLRLVKPQVVCIVQCPNC